METRLEWGVEEGEEMKDLPLDPPDDLFESDDEEDPDARADRIYEARHLEDDDWPVIHRYWSPDTRNQ